jgi:hypothetical protein
MAINRILKYISLAAVVAGVSVMLGMLIWAYRLDADISGRYDCCTQEAVVSFQRRFWLLFFIGAGLAISGSFALSALLRSRNALMTGFLTLGAGALLLFIVVPRTSVHGWTGASAITLILAVFCSGTVLVIVGTLRLGWNKLRS